MGTRQKLLCTVAVAAMLAGINGVASAADLPMKAAPYAPAVAPTTWTGFYMGGHFGYGASKMSGVSSDGGILAGDMKLNGGVGGVHAGYNWQFNQVVFGVEGDISGVFGNGWGKTVCEVGNCASGAHGAAQGLASIRGRLGWAFDRTLLYATGGVAWGLYQGQLMSGSSQKLDSTVATGGVVGAGVEWKYNQNLSFRLEGLHYMFNKTFSGDSDASTPPAYLKVHNFDVVRVGASYHF